MPPRKTNDDGAPKGAKKKPTKAEKNDALLKSDDIERVRVEKDVPQIASAIEAQRMSHELAKVTLELKQHETDLAAYGAEKRKKMRPLRKEQQRLAQAVDGNTIMKRVSVVEVRDYKLNQLRYEGLTDEGEPDGKPVPGLEPVVMPAEMRQQQLFESGDDVRVAAEEDEEEDLDVDEDDEPEDE